MQLAINVSTAATRQFRTSCNAAIAGSSKQHTNSAFVLSRAPPKRNYLSGSQPRSFYSSSVAQLPRLSRSLRCPRWINGKRSVFRGGASESDPLTDEDNYANDRRTKLSSENDSADNGSAPSSSSSSSASSSGGDDNANRSSSPPEAPPPPSNPSSPQTSISKPSVPEVYPRVLALPIARRPLFPGFYKAVVVRNPAVVAAIKEMMRRGQPYLGAFLLKDENTDSDVITDINSVHPVGVFAQITSVFATTGKDDKEEGLTAVLYPHRRIRLTELVKAGSDGSLASVTVENDAGLPTPPTTPQSSTTDLPSSELSVSRPSSGKLS